MFLFLILLLLLPLLLSVAALGLMIYAVIAAVVMMAGMLIRDP